MITILGFALLLFIPVMISEKDYHTGWADAVFNSIPAFFFGGLIGLCISVFIPYKTDKINTKYNLEKIGDSYIKSEKDKFTIMYNSRLVSGEKDKFDIKNADSPSVIVHQKNKSDTFWNYFSVGVDITTYTLYIPTK